MLYLQMTATFVFVGPVVLPSPPSHRMILMKLELLPVSQCSSLSLQGGRPGGSKTWRDWSQNGRIEQSRWRENSG